MTRPPVFAGQFYPDNPQELSNLIENYLLVARTYQDGKEGNKGSNGKEGRSNLMGLGNTSTLRGIIVPHAGYFYSGQTAAVGYALVKKLLDINIDYRIWLIGPSHQVSIGEGSALGQDFDQWETPLGKATACPPPKLKEVIIDNQAHQIEHSLEVQVPFLQRIFKNLCIQPLLINSPSTRVYVSIHKNWGLDHDFLIVSADLSHYLPQKQVEQRDGLSSNIIEALDLPNLAKVDSCGQAGIGLALYLARQRNWQIKRLAYSTSGDVTGDYSSVVGYGCWGIFEEGE